VIVYFFRPLAAAMPSGYWSENFELQETYLFYIYFFRYTFYASSYLLLGWGAEKRFDGNILPSLFCIMAIKNDSVFCNGDAWCKSPQMKLLYLSLSPYSNR
jgi:hypothetical protein